MPAGSPVLIAEGVGVSRGKRVLLPRVDLTLHRGEVVVVLGPNGVGKSTMLSVFAGLLPKSAGTITLHGRVAAALQAPALARRSRAREPRARDGLVGRAARRARGACARRARAAARRASRRSLRRPAVGRRGAARALRARARAGQRRAAARRAVRRPRSADARGALERHVGGAARRRPGDDGGGARPCRGVGAGGPARRAARRARRRAGHAARGARAAGEP